MGDKVPGSLQGGSRWLGWIGGNRVTRQVSQGPVVLPGAPRSANTKWVFHCLLREGGDRLLEQRVPWSGDTWGCYVCP